jgi:hypothetical protein
MAEKILTNQADRSLVSEGKPSLGEGVTLVALDEYLKRRK